MSFHAQVGLTYDLDDQEIQIVTAETKDDRVARLREPACGELAYETQ